MKIVLDWLGSAFSWLVGAFIGLLSGIVMIVGSLFAVGSMRRYWRIRSM